MNLCTQKQKHLKCRTRPLHPLLATVPTAARPLRRASRGPHVLQREADLFLLRVEVIAPSPLHNCSVRWPPLPSLLRAEDDLFLLRVEVIVPPL